MPDPDTPPSGPPSEPPQPPRPPLGSTPPERPIPRGCHPLVFGVVMATIQLGLTVYFMGWCGSK